MNASITTFTLRTIHPFGISRGTTTESEIFYVELEGGGTGEGAVVRYKGQTVEEGMALAKKLVADVTAENIYDINGHMERARRIAPSHSAARAAFDIALHDRVARDLNIPLWKLLGFGSPDGTGSSFTISLESDDRMVAKAEEAESYPHLKIKLGRDDWEVDAKTLRAIRDVAPKKVIRVDANAGWSLETARRMIKVCADLDIEFVEAPLAIGNLEETGILRGESPLPIIADEDVQDGSTLPALVGKVDGINIKLMKCGGLWEARQMIGFARAQGWQVMIGCMLESSIGIAAGAHLAGAAVSLDLDAELLIANNPCNPGPVMQTDGSLRVPNAPGLGVNLNSDR